MPDTEFKPIPPDLYRQVEPQAGQLLEAPSGAGRSARPHDQWWPNWRHLLSGSASIKAVVAGLCCGYPDVPEHAWEGVMRQYCPTAFRMLTRAGGTFAQWNTGKLDAVLTSQIAAQANCELGGYAVFVALDVPAVTAEIIATLGAVPQFVDDDHNS